MRLKAQAGQKSFNWISLICVLLVFGFFSGCATTPESDPIEGKGWVKFREALRFGSKNMKSKMIASLQEAIKLEPKNPDYHLYLGTTYFAEGDLINAEQKLLQTLEVDKDNKDAYRQLGRLYMQQGEWDKAAYHFQEDLNRPGTPYPHRIYNWLALSLYNQGKFNEAEKIWLKAIKLKENASIRLNLALAYRDQENFGQALDTLKIANSLNPKLPQVHFEMARIYVKEKENKKAVTHFKEVILLSPGSERAKTSREFLDRLQPGK